MDAVSRGGNAASSPAAAAAFVLGSPPLAALHSMTEMKSAMLQHYNNSTCGGSANLKNSSHHALPPHVSNMDSQFQNFIQEMINNTDTSSSDRNNKHCHFQSVHSPLSSIGTSTTASGNPHGIDHILNRPSQTLGAAMVAASAVVGASAAAAGAVGLGRLPPGMGMSMSHMAGTAWMGALGKQLELGRPALYWPGLQGLVGNPNLWRDRGNHSGKQTLVIHT